MNLQKNSLVFDIQTYFPAWFSERMIPTKVVNTRIKYLSFYGLFSDRLLLKVLTIIPDLLYSWSTIMKIKIRIKSKIPYRYLKPVSGPTTHTVGLHSLITIAKLKIIIDWAKGGFVSTVRWFLSSTKYSKILAKPVEWLSRNSKLKGVQNYKVPLNFLCIRILFNSLPFPNCSCSCSQFSTIKA